MISETSEAIAITVGHGDFLAVTRMHYVLIILTLTFVQGRILILIMKIINV